MSNGRRSSGALCRVVCHPGTGLIGFATPKKLGCAARRNRMKRRLRHAVRTHVREMHTNFDTIIIGLLDADRAPFKLLVADIAEQIRRATSRWEEE